ncbi:MAG: heavy metal-binding domain-containing protein, partial [Planctomycetota bacterium]
PKTRTVKLRVNVENPDGRLKPGMFVRAVVRAEVAQAGHVMDPAMAGKWICPMHPDIVKDAAGNCDICEMDLVTTESLGYVKIDAPKEAPLVIPASAPLITGTRAVVYVRLAQPDKPTYEGREVVLGPRAGDYYIVNSGLSEGEVVVTKGSFKIDSAMQIRAKPSMMSAPAGQTICPIMGGPINKDVFVEYKGKKVYFCCPGCESQFQENPEKYVDKLPQFKEQ